MERKVTHFLNQKAQSTIEYILLLAVVMSLAMVFLKSDAFQNFFGENSNFFRIVKDQMQVAYRHGYVFPLEEDNNNYGAPHKSFAETPQKSRFFIGLRPYGSN